MEQCEIQYLKAVNNTYSLTGKRLGHQNFIPIQVNVEETNKIFKRAKYWELILKNA